MNKNLNLINSLKSKENNSVIKLYKKIGLQKLGLMTSQAWYDDPKMLLFILARYKFVSKMFSGLKNVLEVGCGDAFASRIVKQTVANLDVSDHDSDLISEAKSRDMKKWKMEYLIHNMIFRSTKKKYDGIYLLDVLEHIDKNKEKKFMKNICRSLKKNGKVIIGMPSKNSQKFASKLSKLGHVNCKTEQDLKKFLKIFFNDVYVFSMNDEVVHTGFYPMSNYFLAICNTKK
tara:strand:+ start:2507 stop:3199 length:693 start_codon:yes stop_codon:yes gene_type:complete